MTDRSAIVDQLADREAIRDVLGRFARGSDRYQRALVESCYWPGAIDRHGGFNGPYEDYACWAEAKTDPFVRMTHVLGHSVFDFAGDVAAVETAFTFFATLPADAGFVDSIMVGRYVDRFERRGGAWRIALRQVAMDWTRTLPDSPAWRDFPPDGPYRTGRRGAEDPISELLAAIGAT